MIIRAKYLIYLLIWPSFGIDGHNGPVRYRLMIFGGCPLWCCLIYQLWSHTWNYCILWSIVHFLRWFPKFNLYYVLLLYSSFMMKFSHFLPAKRLPPNAKRSMFIKSLIIRIINSFIMNMYCIFQEIPSPCLFFLIIIESFNFQCFHIVIFEDIKYSCCQNKGFIFFLSFIVIAVHVFEYF